MNYGAIESRRLNLLSPVQSVVERSLGYCTDRTENYCEKKKEKPTMIKSRKKCPGIGVGR